MFEYRAFDIMLSMMSDGCNGKRISNQSDLENEDNEHFKPCTGHEVRHIWQRHSCDYCKKDVPKETSYQTCMRDVCITVHIHDRGPDIHGGGAVDCANQCVHTRLRQDRYRSQTIKLNGESVIGGHQPCILEVENLSLCNQQNQSHHFQTGTCKRSGNTNKMVLDLERGVDV